METKKVGSITIKTNDRHASSVLLNEVLSKKGQLIRARMGINLVPSCTENCTGLILVAVEGGEEQINELQSELNKIQNVETKVQLF